MQLGVSKYLVQVLQFLVVLILAAKFTFSWRGRKRRLPRIQPTKLPAEQSQATET
jgi:ABC-type uncharacterized transport system permease subunit